MSQSMLLGVWHTRDCRYTNWRPFRHSVIGSLAGRQDITDPGRFSLLLVTASRPSNTGEALQSGLDHRGKVWIRTLRDAIRIDWHLTDLVPGLCSIARDQIAHRLSRLVSRLLQGQPRAQFPDRGCGIIISGLPDRSRGLTTRQKIPPGARANHYGHHSQLLLTS